MLDFFRVFETNPRPVFVFDSAKNIVYQNEVAKDQLSFGTNKNSQIDKSKNIQSKTQQCIDGKGPCEIKELSFESRKYKAVFNSAEIEGSHFVVLMLEEIVDQTSKNENELDHYERALNTLGSIARNTDLEWNQKIRFGLDAAINFLELPLAIISKIKEDSYTVLMSIASDGESIAPGTKFELEGTYCDVTWKNQSIVSTINAGRDPVFKNHPSFINFKLESYLGVPLIVNSRPYGTLNFSSPEVKKSPFSKGEIEFVRILAKWIEAVLESHERERVHKHLTSQSETVQTLFEGVFNESPIGIAVASAERKLQLANKSFLKLYGLKEEEVFGRCTSTLYADPEEYGRQASRFSKNNKEIDSNSYVVKYRRSDGSFFMGETIGYPVHNKEGAVLGFIAQVIDKTEDIKRKKELDEQRFVAQQNSKLAAIGELAAGVGHEINNPLQIINGHLGMILRKVDRSSSLGAGLEKMNFALDRIAKIVGELRTFSRMDESGSSFNVVNAIKETFFLLNQLYLNQGITLELESDIDSLIVHGNRGKFHQVIVNLLSNARDATEGQDHRLIRVTVSRDGEFAKVVVKDNGQGIKKEDMENIFNPFFTTKAPNVGTGIGLAVTHRIVKEHGGEIHCQSLPGRGCEFTVMLPELIDKVQDREVLDSKTFLSNALPFKSILIVDDEEDIGEVLEEFFEEEGVETTLVNSAEKALKVLSEDKNYDLVLSDMQMSGMSGLELFEILKVMDPTIKKALMTGGVDLGADKEEKISKIADTIILKPFSPENALERLVKLFTTS